MENKEITIKENIVYNGKILDLYSDDVLVTFNNHKTKREYIKPHNASCILVIKDNKVLFVKQYRYAVKSSIIEIPAGKIDAGEDSKSAAIRELHEETGLVSKNMTFLGSFYPSAGNSSEEIFVYFTDSFDLDKQNLDENENISLIYLTFDEINEYYKKGLIKDSKFLVGLSLYKLYLENKGKN